MYINILFDCEKRNRVFENNRNNKRNKMKIKLNAK